jgi:hypothetical protein
MIWDRGGIHHHQRAAYSHSILPVDLIARNMQKGRGGNYHRQSFATWLILLVHLIARRIPERSGVHPENQAAEPALRLAEYCQNEFQMSLQLRKFLLLPPAP